MLVSSASSSLPPRYGLGRSIAVAIVAVLMAAIGVCQTAAAAAAPITSQKIDRSGQRIEFAMPQPLVVPGRGNLHHDVKSLLNVTKPLGYGDYVWSADGIPQGRVWVLVDLGAQTMSVFRAGHEIGTTVMLYGMKSKPSPTGDLKVLQKTKNYWSHTYDAPMPYALRLTNDGVAIHGSHVRYDSATHGCLGVPIDFARRLFSVVNVGDEVIILPPSHGHKA